MGNYKFRLSDMMPNAWFYKLRDMSRTRNHNTSRPVKKKLPSPTAASHKPQFSQPRHSNYYEFYGSPTNPKASDTHFPDPPPRKSSKRKTIYKPSPRLVTSSVSADYSFHTTLNSVWNKPEPKAQAQDYFSSSTDQSSPEPEFKSNTIDAAESFSGLASWSSSCSCRVTSSTTDIIIDMNETSSYSRKVDKPEGVDTISELQLPPIATKEVKFKDKNSKVTKLGRSSSKFEERKAHGSLCVKIVKEDTCKTQKETKTSPLTRKPASYSTGVKLQVNSPRIASKKVQAYGRRRSVSSCKSLTSQSRSFSESFAIVKSSFDPQRDFKDSMVEMIVENDIRASKDLEELLACYLTLNSDEFHDLIVKAFEQIWLDSSVFD